MAASLAVRPRPVTGQRTLVGGIPLVRVRPVPQFEPPYDDERPPHEPSGQQEPREPQPREPAERIARSEPDVRYQDEQRRPAPADGAPPRAGSGGQAARRYVGLCVEVLEGFRPAVHLRRLTVASAFDTVLEQLALPGARLGHPSSAGPMPGDPTPSQRSIPVARPAGRIGGGPGGRRADRLRLRRLWVGEPSAGVVEAAAVLGRGDRAWAVALRLQRHDEGWLCTDLQIV